MPSVFSCAVCLPPHVVSLAEYLKAASYKICRAGGASIESTDLASRYHTHCDPRLNAEQALEMAFYVSERLKQRRLKRAAALAAKV
jgi:Class-II DAHP synthetase family